MALSGIDDKRYVLSDGETRSIGNYKIGTLQHWRSLLRRCMKWIRMKPIYHLIIDLFNRLNFVLDRLEDKVLWSKTRTDTALAANLKVKKP